MFSLLHITTLISMLLGVILIVKFIPDKIMNITMKVISIVLIILQLSIFVYDLLHYGTILWHNSLPLNICRLFIPLYPFAVFMRKENMFWRSVTSNCATFAIIAAIAGALFDERQAEAVWSFHLIQAIVLHFLMIVGSCLLWKSGRYKPIKKDIFLSFIPVVILVAICWVLYDITGWEYSFVAGRKGTPLYFFYSLMPQAVYIILLYSLAFVGNAAIFYNKWVFKKVYGSDKIIK